MYDMIRYPYLHIILINKMVIIIVSPGIGQAEGVYMCDIVCVYTALVVSHNQFAVLMRALLFICTGLEETMVHPQ